jgi:hypothetical protein
VRPTDLAALPARDHDVVQFDSQHLGVCSSVGRRGEGSMDGMPVLHSIWQEYLFGAAQAAPRARAAASLAGCLVYSPRNAHALNGMAACQRYGEANIQLPHPQGPPVAWAASSPDTPSV